VQEWLDRQAGRFAERHPRVFFALATAAFAGVAAFLVWTLSVLPRDGGVVVAAVIGLGAGCVLIHPRVWSNATLFTVGTLVCVVAVVPLLGCAGGTTCQREIASVNAFPPEVRAFAAALFLPTTVAAIAATSRIVIRGRTSRKT
jgi:hypothetical protein